MPITGSESWPPKSAAIRIRIGSVGMQSSASMKKEITRSSQPPA